MEYGNLNRIIELSSNARRKKSADDIKCRDPGKTGTVTGFIAETNL